MVKFSGVYLVVLTALALGTAGCDLATKRWVQDTLSAPNAHARGVCARDERTGDFVPTPVRRALLLLGSLAAAVAVVAVARQAGARHRLAHAGAAWVLGGAVGNLVDRAARGYVVDFVRAHWGPRAWPLFNVADVAIAVGIGLLLLGLRPDPTRDGPGAGARPTP